MPLDNPLGEQATKEIYTPVVDTTNAAVSYLGAIIVAPGEEAGLQLLVPQDFSAITSLEVIFVPRATGAAMKLTITTNYGQYNSEDYDAHTDTEADRSIGATVGDRHIAHSIADLVAGLAAGDLLRVLIDYSAVAQVTNVYVCGLRLKYT